ncbi:hypothetical protein ABE10_11360 [Bacillus toyonensis]|nr:hypothetical protein [Bacillus toyonensis]
MGVMGSPMWVWDTRREDSSPPPGEVSVLLAEDARKLCMLGMGCAAAVTNRRGGTRAEPRHQVVMGGTGEFILRLKVVRVVEHLPVTFRCASGFPGSYL